MRGTQVAFALAAIALILDASIFYSYETTRSVTTTVATTVAKNFTTTTTTNIITAQTVYLQPSSLTVYVGVEGIGRCNATRWVDSDIETTSYVTTITTTSGNVTITSTSTVPASHFVGPTNYTSFTTTTTGTFTEGIVYTWNSSVPLSQQEEDCAPSYCWVVNDCVYVPENATG